MANDSNFKKRFLQKLQDAANGKEPEPQKSNKSYKYSSNKTENIPGGIKETKHSQEVFYDNNFTINFDDISGLNKQVSEKFNNLFKRLQNSGFTTNTEFFIETDQPFNKEELINFSDQSFIQDFSTGKFIKEDEFMSNNKLVKKKIKLEDMSDAMRKSMENLYKNFPIEDGAITMFVPEGSDDNFMSDISMDPTIFPQPFFR